MMLKNSKSRRGPFDCPCTYMHMSPSDFAWVNTMSDFEKWQFRQVAVLCGHEALLPEDKIEANLLVSCRRIAVSLKCT